MYDLLRGRLRFKHIATFNDPFEARPAYAPAFPDDERQRRAMRTYLTHIARVEGSVSKRRWADEMLNGRSMAELVEALSRNAENSWRSEEIYVLCMSAVETESSPLLWSHYADSHRGVCIHFDTAQPPLSLAYKVDYGEDYPTLLIPRTEQSEEDLIRITLVRKCSQWAYENEYRAISVRMDGATHASKLFVEWDGDFAIAPLHVAASVTLGAGMPEPIREKLVSWVQQHVPHVSVFQARLHRSRYEVVKEPVYTPPIVVP